MRPIVILLLSLALTTNTLAADWPRFRGPNGAGMVDDAGVLTKWTDADVIKVPVPGRGNGSPIISKGKLFLQAASADGAERMLICYDAATLKQQWIAKVAGGKGKTHAKNSLASSTPAADNNRIYCLFWDGNQIGLFAFDYSGKQLWRTPLGSFKSQHGAGQSPVSFNGKVYLNNDQDGHAEFVCFDGATGKKVWSVERTPFRSCYSSPFFLPDGKGGTEVVISSTAGLAGYEPDTGKPNWQWSWSFEGMALRTVGCAVASTDQGTIFAISGDGNGARHMVAVRRTSNPELIWEKKRGTPYVPVPLIQGDYIYWINDNGFAICCEAKTGNEVFNEHVTSGVTASPILVNGNIYAINERGTVFVFAAKPKYEQLHKAELDEQVFASPAVTEGRLYIRGQSHLFVIGKGVSK
jgi:outer membrane protein assembly factor BamB